MTIKPFVYCSATRFGETVAQCVEEEIPAPAWMAEPERPWGFDRFGILNNGQRLRSGVAKLIRLENVSVQRTSLGSPRYHVILEDGICAAESYNTGPWVQEWLAVGTDRGNFNVNLMDDVEIGATVETPHVLISHHWQDNYAHSILETASRFWSPIPNGAKLIWESRSPAQTELQGRTAEISIGVELPIVKLPAERTLYRQLWLPMFRAPHCVSQGQVDFLRPRLMMPADRDSPKRLYVSRADAGVRRVQNEPALVAALADAGFTAVNLTGMTMRAQAALFRGAEIVVGPHGAGMVNTLFCDHARVVELVPDAYQHPLYGLLSEFCGNEYHRLISTSDPKNHNMFADIERVMRAIAG